MEITKIDVLYFRIRFVLFFIFLSVLSMNGQITERDRPVEWNNLVEGGRFMDYFMPMPQGVLSAETWGEDNVKPRYIDNGIEDNETSYWGGNILKSKDNLYHLYICGWPESSAEGHMEWPNSTVYHAVCSNPTGPFVVKNIIGKGHNPEAFVLKDGRIVVYVIGGYYISNGFDGPWEYQKFEFDNRDRKINEGLSNLTFAQREDGSYLMICRGGGVWISRTGLSPYCQISDKSVYPAIDGEFEDPVVWRDNIQYNLIVNDWLGRIAYYLRSKDGVKWIVEPGEAYSVGIARHENGHKEDWFKYERIKILQDEAGRAIQANFAVIDVLKEKDKGNDNHSSKNISIPLNKGLLLKILNKEKIGLNTKIIKLEIKTEDGFNPQTEVDVNSLRFGLPSDVSYGRGYKAISTEKSGKNLIVNFEWNNTTQIPVDEYALKLIGKNNSDKLMFGYALLPQHHLSSMLSSRKPVIDADTKKISVEIQNFGQKESKAAEIIIKGKYELASGSMKSLKPYEKTVLSLPMKNTSDINEHIIVQIKENGREAVSNEFS